MTELIKFELKNKIARITLNRPEKRNALTFEMLEELYRIGKNLKSINHLSAVVIKGSGKNFSSGIDINNFSLLAGDRPFLQKLLSTAKGSSGNKMQLPCTIWQEIHAPVFAVLDGSVFGAGLQLALGADIRIASKNVQVSIMETKWGLIPDMGISLFLPQLMRYDQALNLTLRADLINASDAKKLGLITQVSNNPNDEVEKSLSDLSMKSPDAIKSVKKLYKCAWPSVGKDGLELEASLQRNLIGTANQMEAVLANFEKRKARFD